MASGNTGKIIAGCSCLAMVLCLTIILIINFALVPLATQFPDLAVMWAFLGGMGSWISYGCCCLSGAGMLVGIIMLLMAGKKEVED